MDESEKKKASSPSGLRRISEGSLDILAGTLLFVLMVLTLADVVGRYFLTSPVPGAFEVTQILLALVIFAALPVATARREHIVVDVLDEVLNKKLLTRQKVGAEVVTTLIFAALAWLVWELGNRASVSGWMTDRLKIPMAPIAYFAAGMAAVAAIFSSRNVFRR